NFTLPRLVEEAQNAVRSAPAARLTTAEVAGQGSEALFGYALESGARVVFFGAAGVPRAVRLYSPSGEFLLEQRIDPDGTLITFASGDAMELHGGARPERLTYRLMATTPPTELVIELSDTTATFRPDLSTISNELNPEYGSAAARDALARSNPKS